MKYKFDKIFNIIIEQIQNSLKYDNLTLAIVPGSFKPPHKGHWEMVTSYINDVDKIIVIISNISKSSLSNKPLSQSKLKDLLNLSKIINNINIIEYPQIEKDVHIINSLIEKIDNLSYTELKNELEKIDNSEIIDLNDYVKFRKTLTKYLIKLDKTVFSSIRTDSNGNEISPECSKEIFEIFSNAYGVSDKVEIRISDSASPLVAAYNLIKNECAHCKILMGVSTKGGDEKRFDSFNDDDENGNEIIPTPVAVQTLLSATDLRNNINNLKKEWFPDKLSNTDFEKIKQMLNTPVNF